MMVDEDGGMMNEELRRAKRAEQSEMAHKVSKYLTIPPDSALAISLATIILYEAGKSYEQGLDYGFIAGYCSGHLDCIREKAL
jgi:hypothetical protein